MLTYSVLVFVTALFGFKSTAEASVALHTCRISLGGDLACWGYNKFGQLGLGHKDSVGDQPGELGTNLPNVDLNGHKVTQVATNHRHTCAILDNGKVACWGSNNYGQLGRGDQVNIGDDEGEMGAALHQIGFDAGKVSEIALGQGHSCALTKNGEVWCWGMNDKGQLGIGSADQMKTSPQGPVNLGTGRTANHISAGGSHTCAILDNGALVCWGSNGRGELGIGGTTNVGSHPDDMGDNLIRADLGCPPKQVVVGLEFTCVLCLSNGQTVCFGSNEFGQLGIGSTDSIGDQEGEMGGNLKSVDFGYGKQAVSLVSGYWHSCAILSDGEVVCWGRNQFGQLGAGNTLTRGDKPGDMGAMLPRVDLNYLSRNIKSLTTGGAHTCAITMTNQVVCWGFNAEGGLGIGSTENIGDETGEMGINLKLVDLIDTPSCVGRDPGEMWCNNDGSSTYFQCANGEAVKRTLAPGTKCCPLFGRSNFRIIASDQSCSVSTPYNPNCSGREHGEQFCDPNDATKIYYECVHGKLLERPLAPGTRCCIHSSSKRMILQHLSMTCPNSGTSQPNPNPSPDTPSCQGREHGEQFCPADTSVESLYFECVGGTLFSRPLAPATRCCPAAAKRIFMQHVQLTCPAF